MGSKTLLILPCNACVRLGDYSLCPNWKIVLKHVRALVEAGALDLAAVDSCKPGIVLWGEETGLRWCDLNPRWDRLYGRDPVRLDLLAQAVARDLRELSLRYKAIAFYVNVKAYRLALKKATEITGVELLDLGPPKPNPLSYNKHARELPLLLASKVTPTSKIPTTPGAHVLSAWPSQHPPSPTQP